MEVARNQSTFLPKPIVHCDSEETLGNGNSLCPIISFKAESELEVKNHLRLSQRHSEVPSRHPNRDRGSDHHGSVGAIPTLLLICASPLPTRSGRATTVLVPLCRHIHCKCH